MPSSTRQRIAGADLRPSVRPVVRRGNISKGLHCQSATSRVFDDKDVFSVKAHLRLFGRPNHERAHPDGHAVRKVRIALEHQVVSPSWFVHDANNPEIHVCLTDSVRSPAPDVVQTVLRSGTVADEQIAVHTNYVCRAILGSYRGGCEDFAGEWDHDLAAAGAVVIHKVSDSNVTT